MDQGCLNKSPVCILINFLFQFLSNHSFRCLPPMSGIAPVSRTELAQRRKQLRHERRTRLLTNSWRSIVVLGLAAGTIWVIGQPNWVIHKAEQVKIEGNRFLATQTIRSLLPIQYPQSLMKIQASEISQALTTKAPIAETTVERHLFPPALIIKVREREPVAQVFLAANAPIPKAERASTGDKSDKTAETLAEKPQEKSQEKSQEKPQEKSQEKSGTSLRPYGFLDENGMLLPLESYRNLTQDMKLPDLKLIGDPEMFRNQWSALYPIVRRSPVKIETIDWQTPSNLKLKTELGMVHVGALGRLFPSQVRALDRMRQLPNRLPPAEIEFIDLRNPGKPLIQMKRGKPPIPSPTMPPEP
jgi:cell division protein FtsQ